MKKPALFVSGFVLLLSLKSLAQNDSLPVKKKEEEPFNRKKEIVYDNKRYRVYNNYVTLGYGYANNSHRKANHIAVNADFNFHIQKQYFQFGAVLSGKSIWQKDVIILHLGAGYRKETATLNFAAFGGISYSEGFYLQKTDSVTYVSYKKAPGFYAAVHAHYKPKFDYGIGAGAFVETNKYQTIIGVRIELFFSGAYRGEKRRP